MSSKYLATDRTVNLKESQNFRGYTVISMAALKCGLGSLKALYRTEDLVARVPFFPERATEV
jgi:hypothetical protein